MVVNTVSFMLFELLGNFFKNIAFSNKITVKDD